MLPGATEDLEVSYAGASGTPVEFAVLAPEADVDRGPAEEPAVSPGASLDPANALVDGAGRARTRLTVGSTPGTFRVRARILGVEPVFFEIEVSPVAQPSVAVLVRYEGLREVSSRSAAVVLGMSCSDELPIEKPNNVEVRTSDDPKMQLEFPLVPKAKYAILAWGRDSTGAVQAFGCAEHTALLTDDKLDAESVVYVDIDDRPLRFVGSFPLELNLDLSASMARLGDTTEAAARAQLSDEEFANAALYFDAVQATLEGLNKTAEAEQWAAQRASVLAGLDAALAPKGIELAGSELAQALQRIGKSLSVGGTLGVGATNSLMELSIHSLVARSMEGTLAFDLMTSFAKLTPSAQILASYDDARAQVQVQNLGISLGLGAYGAALLDGLLAREASDANVPAWRGAAGCDALSAFVTGEPLLSHAGAPLCDAACALSACDTVLRTFLSDARAAMAQLDSQHGTISLTGPVSAHDRGNDDTIDDLGPSTLNGNWGKPDDDDSVEDGVSATLMSVPSESALTL